MNFTVNLSFFWELEMEYVGYVEVSTLLESHGKS